MASSRFCAATQNRRQLTPMLRSRSERLRRAGRNADALVEFGAAKISRPHERGSARYASGTSSRASFRRPLEVSRGPFSVRQRGRGPRRRSAWSRLHRRGPHDAQACTEALPEAQLALGILPSLYEAKVVVAEAFVLAGATESGRVAQRRHGEQHRRPEPFAAGRALRRQGKHDAALELDLRHARRIPTTPMPRLLWGVLSPPLKALPRHSMPRSPPGRRSSRHGPSSPRCGSRWATCPMPRKPR